jgi:hypothetical protein
MWPLKNKFYTHEIAIRSTIPNDNEYAFNMDIDQLETVLAIPCGR